MTNVVPLAATSAPIITFEIPGDPVAFARAHSHGNQRYTPPKQRKAMMVIRDAALRAKGRLHIWEGVPVALELSAVFKYPESWPAKRKVPQWKTSRPDVDNVAKLCGDSCNGIIYADDAQIASISCHKVYGPEAKLIVTFYPIAGAPV